MVIRFLGTILLLAIVPTLAATATTRRQPITPFHTDNPADGPNVSALLATYIYFSNSAHGSGVHALAFTDPGMSVFSGGVTAREHAGWTHEPRDPEPPLPPDTPTGDRHTTLQPHASVVANAGAGAAGSILESRCRMVSEGELDGVWVTYTTLTALVLHTVPAAGGQVVLQDTPMAALNGDALPINWRTSISSRVTIEVCATKVTATGNPLTAVMNASGTGVATTNAAH